VKWIIILQKKLHNKCYCFIVEGVCTNPLLAGEHSIEIWVGECEEAPLTQPTKVVTGGFNAASRLQIEEVRTDLAVDGGECFSTTTTLYHYHLVPLPPCITTTLYHYHLVPLPPCTVTILYHYHLVPLPPFTTTTLYRYHLVPLPYISQPDTITRYHNHMPQRYTQLLHTTILYNTMIIHYPCNIKPPYILPSYSTITLYIGCYDYFSVFQLIHSLSLPHTLVIQSPNV